VLALYNYLLATKTPRHQFSPNIMKRTIYFGEIWCLGALVAIKIKNKNLIIRRSMLTVLLFTLALLNYLLATKTPRHQFSPNIMKRTIYFGEIW